MTRKHLYTRQSSSDAYEPIQDQIKYNLQNIRDMAETMGARNARIGVGRERQFYISFRDDEIQRDNIPDRIEITPPPADITEPWPLYEYFIGRVVERAQHENITITGWSRKRVRPEDIDMEDEPRGFERHPMGHYLSKQEINIAAAAGETTTEDDLRLTEIMQEEAGKLGIRVIPRPTPGPNIYPCAGHTHYAMTGEIGFARINLFSGENGIPNELMFWFVEEMQQALTTDIVLCATTHNAYDRLVNNNLVSMSNGLGKIKKQIGLMIRGDAITDNNYDGIDTRLELRLASGGLPWRLDGEGAEHGGTDPYLLQLVATTALRRTFERAVREGARFNSQGELIGMPKATIQDAYIKGDDGLLLQTHKSFPETLELALEVFREQSALKPLLGEVPFMNLAEQLAQSIGRQVSD